ncbi:unnamed protein product [Mesocestoides corti]|uniref:DZF domain-containing protein n=1 Tax=Mesocestoides corti TaxID=53468 RepID=A0A0R3U5B0_MESCO|nr:unnamed protein product [Mesocestoides corti]
MLLLVFLQHKNLCLQELEPSAERCSHQTDEAIQEVVEALKNQSTNVSLVLTGDSFHQNLKKIMLLYECKAMKKKLGCLLSLLSSRCPTDVVQLIMNYFIESLPVGCQYSYRAPGFPDGRFANPPVMQRDDGNPPPLAHTPQQLIASTSGATATHLLLLPIHAAIYTLAGICVD